MGSSNWPPKLGHALILSDHAYGIWAGLATVAGALYSDAAAKLAVLTKTTRNAIIGTEGSSSVTRQQNLIPLLRIPEIRFGIPSGFAVSNTVT